MEFNPIKFYKNWKLRNSNIQKIRKLNKELLDSLLTKNPKSIKVYLSKEISSFVKPVWDGMIKRIVEAKSSDYAKHYPERTTGMLMDYRNAPGYDNLIVIWTLDYKDSLMIDRVNPLETNDYIAVLTIKSLKEFGHWDTWFTFNKEN